MIKKNLLYCLAAVCLLGQPIFSQSSDKTPTLGLPGDNLDLYAVLDLFQKSKTVEDFEKSLNEKESDVNNLDLDLDKKVDFIKVISKKQDPSYTFILQVAVSKTETQDVAVILVDKDKNGKVSLQIVGDEDLYGKNYVIEPKPAGTASVTANPAYTGSNPVTKDVSATTIVVETVPIVQYVYSPFYVPYYPPYYYGYYPPYYRPFAVIAIGVYRHHHYHHHGHYYGGHYGGRNTVIIRNTNVYNDYNINRTRSNTVIANREHGKYNVTKNSTNRVSTRNSTQKLNNNRKNSSVTTRNTTVKKGSYSGNTVRPANRTSVQRSVNRSGRL
jgi:hypothetical protein